MARAGPWPPARLCGRAERAPHSARASSCHSLRHDSPSEALPRRGFTLLVKSARGGCHSGRARVEGRGVRAKDRDTERWALSGMKREECTYGGTGRIRHPPWLDVVRLVVEDLGHHQYRRNYDLGGADGSRARRLSSCLTYPVTGTRCRQGDIDGIELVCIGREYVRRCAPSYSRLITDRKYIDAALGGRRGRVRDQDGPTGTTFCRQIRQAFVDRPATCRAAGRRPPCRALMSSSCLHWSEPHAA